MTTQSATSNSPSRTAMRRPPIVKTVVVGGLMLVGAVFAHVFLVGLPISFTTRWYSNRAIPR